MCSSDLEDKDSTTSWIRAKGNLSSFVNKMLIDIKRKENISQMIFSKKMAGEMGCKKDSVFNHFSAANNNREIFYSLVFLDKLVNNWAETCNKSKNKIKEHIYANIHYLTIGNRTSNVIKAAKSLSLLFCRIIGAHAADGTLSKNYQIILSDGHKEIGRASCRERV